MTSLDHGLVDLRPALQVKEIKLCFHSCSLPYSTDVVRMCKQKYVSAALMATQTVFGYCWI